jgi:hypothetical protein
MQVTLGLAALHAAPLVRKIVIGKQTSTICCFHQHSECFPSADIWMGAGIAMMD